MPCIRQTSCRNRFKTFLIVAKKTMRLIQNLRFGAASSLIALILLSLAWESILAPLKPGGTMLMLKAVPLLLPLFGILRGKRYTYQWACMFILLYFTEGVVRAWSD